MFKPVFTELFIDHSDSDRSVIHLFSAQPSPLEETNLGRLFALIEFDSSEGFFENLVQQLDEAFSATYYRSADFEVEAAFERTMQKMNKVVQEAVSQYGESWVYHTNALLGVIHGTTVHFSYIGKIEGWLVREEDMTPLIDHDADVEIKPLKLFNNIISGQCSDKQQLLFSTANILDYLSLEKIRRTILGRSGPEAVAQFSEVLTAGNALSNIAAFVVHFDKASKVAPAVDDEDTDLERTEFTDQFQGQQDSMSKLINQERQTGELLAPSIWPTVKKRLTALGKNSDQTVPSYSSSPNYGRNPSPVVGALLQGLIVIKNIGIQIVLGLAFIVRKLYEAIRSWSNGSGRLQGRSLKRWFFGLSRPRQILLGVVILIIVWFTGSLLLQGKAVKQDDQSETYQQTLSQVQNLLGEADSKQIMKDEGGARTLVTQADTALKTVPVDSEPYKAQGVELRTKIDALMNTLNKVTVLADLQPLADFTTAAATADIKQITKIGDNIFAFDHQTNEVYRVNLSSNDISTIIPATANEPAYVSAENDSVGTSLVLLTNGSFIQFSPFAEKNSPVQVALDDTAKVIDFDLFGTRLYSLDNVNNQIYRQQKSGEVYGSTTNWLTDTVDLSQAVSFDIDSSIYVLFSTGVIKKYDNGAESKLTVDAFSPSLEGATSLAKPDTTSPFYVLNPTTQRLVMINANGTLDKQITSPAFDKLQAMLVDEPTKAAYVVSANKLYKIEL